MYWPTIGPGRFTGATSRYPLSVIILTRNDRIRDGIVRPPNVRECLLGEIHRHFLAVRKMDKIVTSQIECQIKENGDILALLYVHPPDLARLKLRIVFGQDRDQQPWGMRMRRSDKRRISK